MSCFSTRVEGSVKTVQAWRNKGYGTLTILFAAITGGALFGANSAYSQGLVALDAIVEAHGVNRLPPISVQMTGSVQRDGGKPEPFRILATRDEELRIDYGAGNKDTHVVSQKLNFRDDGTKFEYSRVPSGFAQLDITGLFLIEHLRNRAIRVEQAQDKATVAGTPATKLIVQGERTQVHKGNINVGDRADLYVGPNGLLTAISRSFYEGRPERYTQAFLFSDYRKTGDDGLLLPYRVELYIKGHLRQAFQIETYQFDIPADRELFLSRRPR
jgi:hypothetical protein